MAPWVRSPHHHTSDGCVGRVTAVAAFSALCRCCRHPSSLRPKDTRTPCYGHCYHPPTHTHTYRYMIQIYDIDIYIYIYRYTIYVIYLGHPRGISWEEFPWARGPRTTEAAKPMMLTPQEICRMEIAGQCLATAKLEDVLDVLTCLGMWLYIRDADLLIHNLAQSKKSLHALPGCISEASAHCPFGQCSSLLSRWRH